MAESLLLEGKKAQFKTGRGQKTEIPIEQLSKAISECTVSGMTDEPIPDNVRWSILCGSLQVIIAELKPELRWIKWLAENSPFPFGPEATSKGRQLATPYVILKVPFRRGKLLHRVEVFFRNEPLTSMDGDGGRLYWPNLLNVSPHAYGCQAWFCTQYIESDGSSEGVTCGLNTVLNHLWGGSFNASSEAHEGMSTHSLCIKENVDRRVTDANLWEKESKKDPKFVLSIDWKPAGVTVADLIEREFKANRIATAPATASTIGNILLRKKKPK